MPITTSQDKREKILTAAEHLIAQVGFHGFSMHLLAKEAKVAIGTIYLYFSDKEHLLTELHLSITKRIATAVQEGIDESMPLKIKYQTMWLNLWKLASANINAICNRIQFASLPKANNKETRELEKKLFYQLDDLFTQGKKDGIFKNLDNEILSGLSFEPCVALARKYALGFYQLDKDILQTAMDASWDAIIKH